MTRFIAELFSPEALAAKPELLERRAWELPTELLAPLSARCAQRGVAFGVTPFSLRAVEAVAPFCDFLKVASYELLWHDLLRACARTGLPLVVSTGMATDAEVDAAVAAVRAAGGADLTLLHCVSAYPTPPADCNLAAIAALRERHGCAVGWSDHSGEPAVVARAVRRWGASDVELHVDAEAGDGHEAGEHNWTPAERHDVAWRADPGDGLRPLQATRAALRPS